MESFTIKVPISVVLGIKKKKKYYLNLNLLRNQQAHLNNNIKRAYKEIVTPLIPDVFYEHFEIDYLLFLPNKLKRDISNVLAIVDKNFCDTFIETGHGIDDNYEHLKKVTYRYGGQDDTKEGYVMVTVRKV